MFKKVRKITALVLGIIIVLVLGLFVAMSIFNSPTYAWRVLRYGESDIGDYAIFPERVISNGEKTSVIQRGDESTPSEVEYPYKGEMRKDILNEVLQRSGTRAFLVLKDDKLIFESYFDSSREEINTSFSTAKSFNSALIGAAI